MRHNELIGRLVDRVMGCNAASHRQDFGVMDALGRKFSGSASDWQTGYQCGVDAINALEPEVAALSDEALKARTAEFRRLLADRKTLDDILAATPHRKDRNLA